MADTLIITGGAEFIGSNFVFHCIEKEQGNIFNLDRLTYAGNPLNLEQLEKEPRHKLL